MCHNIMHLFNQNVNQIIGCKTLRNKKIEFDEALRESRSRGFYSFLEFRAPNDKRNTRSYQVKINGTLISDF